MKNRFVLLALWGALLYNAPMMASGAPAPAAAVDDSWLDYEIDESSVEGAALSSAVKAMQAKNLQKGAFGRVQDLKRAHGVSTVAKQVPGIYRAKVAAKAAYNALLAETPEYESALLSASYADYVAPDEQALSTAKSAKEWGYDPSDYNVELTGDALEASKQDWIDAQQKAWESRSASQKAQALVEARQARLAALYDGRLKQDARMQQQKKNSDGSYTWHEVAAWERADDKEPYFIEEAQAPVAVDPSAPAAAAARPTYKFNAGAIAAEGAASLTAKAVLANQQRAANLIAKVTRGGITRNTARTKRRAELDARTFGRRFADHFTGDDFRDAKGANGGFANNKLAMTGRYVDAAGNVVVAVVGAKWLVKGENPIVDALYAKFKDAKKVGRIIGKIAGWFSKSKGHKRFATGLGMLISSEVLGAGAKGRPTLVKGLASGTASLYRKVRGH